MGLHKWNTPFPSLLLVQTLASILHNELEEKTLWKHF